LNKKKHGRFYTNENNKQIAEMVIGISGNDLTVLCGYMGKQRTCLVAVKKQIIRIFILMLLSFFQQI
jgi:hypothetical protein